MKDLQFKDYGLEFTGLVPREDTDMVVIHHTGNPIDDDLSAEDIHRLHLAQGWAGIGYHFVIRKNGIIETGRPLWAVGSHAYGENWHTIGVHVCGNFELALPTDNQIEVTAILIGWLCERYDIPINQHNVVGHRDLMATACPGEYLYQRMDDLRGKAAWYQNYY